MRRRGGINKKEILGAEQKIKIENKKEILGAEKNPLLFLQPLPAALNATFKLDQAAKKMQDVLDCSFIAMLRFFLQEETSLMPGRLEECDQ